MKLAIITCQQLPNGAEEDQALLAALTELGIQSDTVIWGTNNIDWHEYDLCLLRSVWDYHERPTEFSQWLNTTAALVPVINSPEVVHWNKDKRYMSELADFGITIAPTVWLNHNQTFNLESMLNGIKHKKYLLKPVIGANSSGTLRFEYGAQGIEQAQQHLSQWLPQVDMMLQPYISSVETFGETSAIYLAGSFSHAIKKIPVAGDYRLQDNFGAQDIAYELNAIEMSLSRVCHQFLEAKFGNILYARYDFLHGESGEVYLNEAELIEPSLFFNHSPSAAKILAAAIQQLFSEQSPC